MNKRRIVGDGDWSRVMLRLSFVRAAVGPLRGSDRSSHPAACDVTRRPATPRVLRRCSENDRDPDHPSDERSLLEKMVADIHNPQLATVDCSIIFAYLFTFRAWSAARTHPLAIITEPPSLDVAVFLNTVGFGSCMCTFWLLSGVIHRSFSRGATADVDSAVRCAAHTWMIGVPLGVLVYALAVPSRYLALEMPLNANLICTLMVMVGWRAVYTKQRIQ